MEKNIKQTAVVQKIEVDENSLEPKIVEVAEEQQPVTTDAGYHKYDFVSKKSDKSIGKQLAMSKILGVDKEQADSFTKRQKTYKLIFTLVFVVFVVSVLVFTAYKDFFGNDENRIPFSWNKIGEIFSHSWVYLLLAFTALFLHFFFKGTKLSVVCKSMTKRARFKTCFETGIIGLYYNNVTPLAAGGQPFEIYYLSKHGVHGGVATSMSISTFFFNQFSFCGLALVSILFLSKNQLYADIIVFKVMAIVGVILCLTVPILVVVFSLMPGFATRLIKGIIKIGTKLKLVKYPDRLLYKTMKTVIQNSRCLKKIVSRPLFFSFSALLSVFEQIAGVSIAFFVLKFFGFNIVGMTFFEEMVQVLQICLVLSAAISFIPTPGNSGAADLSFFAFFARHLASGLAFPAMMVWRLLAFYSYVIIGFIFATLKKRSDRKKENSKLLTNG